MACSNEIDVLNELDKWGNLDAARETRELRQHLPKSASRFEFITQSNKREVPSSLCSLQEFALSKHVMQLVSRPNSATYLMENMNYNSISTDFKKFIAFIETYPEPGKSELAALIFPIFVHFYLLLLQSGSSGQLQAKAFFNQNRNLFDHEKSYDSILQTLYTFKSIKDIKEDSYYKKFLKYKYIIGISEDVLGALREFIENYAGKPGDKTLLYVLHFHIHFQDNDESVSCENTTYVEDTNDDDFAESESSEVSSKPPYEISDDDNDSSNDSIIKSEDTNSDVDESLIPEDTEPGPSLEDLLQKLNIMHPRISTIVTKCEKCEKNELFSVDFNDNETEVAYALGDDYIYIAPVKIKKRRVMKRPMEDDSDDDSGIRCEEETMEVILVPHSFSQKKRLNTKSAKFSKFPRSLESEMPYPASFSHMKVVKTPGDEKVYQVKYLPGKPHCLLAVCNKTVRLFNTETWSFESEFSGDDAFIFDIDINSTSQLFATANENMESCLYNFNHSTPVSKFQGHQKALTAVRFHPNGLYIATGSDDNTIRLFDIESGLCCRNFIGHTFGIWSIAFSPDGKLLASGDSFGVVKTWDIKDGYEISEVCFTNVIETLARITSLCFHADSSTLAAGNRKGQMKFWDVRDPEHSMMVNFTNIPLNIKFRKSGLWKIAFQSASEESINVNS